MKHRANRGKIKRHYLEMQRIIVYSVLKVVGNAQKATERRLGNYTVKGGIAEG